MQETMKVYLVTAPEIKGHREVWKRSPSMGYIVIAEEEVTFNIKPTEEELLAARVEMLKGKKNKILANAMAEANEVEEVIQSLLALPSPQQETQTIKESEDDDIPW